MLWALAFVVGTGVCFSFVCYIKLIILSFLVHVKLLYHIGLYFINWQFHIIMFDYFAILICTEL